MIFEGILLSIGFQKCASGGCGEHIFEKIRRQNASELKFHRKAVLQIAFLMHIRTKFRGTWLLKALLGGAHRRPSNYACRDRL